MLNSKFLKRLWMMGSREEFCKNLWSYMGFGIMDSESICYQDGLWSVKIYAEKELVHEMTWDGNEYRFCGFWNNQITGVGIATKGKDALIKYFLDTDFTKDPRFGQLYDQVSKFKRINLFIPGEDKNCRYV
jgi:hypothetical protein